MKGKHLPRFLPWIIAGCSYALIAVLISTKLINPYWQQIIQFALIMMISALGLNLIYGYTGQFSLGQAAFYGIGAYTSALITKSFPHGGIPIFILSMFVAVAVVAVVALLIGPSCVSSPTTSASPRWPSALSSRFCSIMPTP
jgi:branched-chain amino acid transport system permease protein